MTDGSIIFETKIDPTGVEKGLDSIKKNTSGFSAAFKKIGGVIASAFAVQKIVQFGKEAIALGSAVAEVQNVVDVAFGEMAYKVEDFAASAIQNFGMSTLAAKKTASNYMSMAKNMGLSMEDASNMAITLAGLTGDVASFYNISQELADVKLKSVFTGETETLKDLGIVMTQDNLKAYALSQGINRSLDSMSQAEKVALRYNFVLDQLSMASGDFARTQDSWANQTRILSMQWQEFMSIIGQALTQILLPAVRVLNQIVSSLINMANALSSALASIFGGTSKQIKQTQADVSGVSSGIGGAVDQQNALTDATKETNKEQQKTLMGFDELNKLDAPNESSGGSGGSTGGASGTSDINPVEAAVDESTVDKMTGLFEKLQAAIEPFRASFEKAFEDIRNGAATLFDVFQKAWDDIGTLGPPLKRWFGDEFTELLNQAIYTIGNSFGGLLDSVGKVFADLWSIVIFPSVQQWAEDILPAMTEFGTEFLETFDTLFDEVKKIFDKIWSEAIAPALVVLQDVASDIWDGLVTGWNEHGAPIFESIRETIENVSGLVQHLWDSTLKPIWDNLMSVADELWNEHLKPLWDKIVAFVGGIVQAALDIYNGFIAPILHWVIDLFGPKIAEGVNKVISIFGDLLGQVSDNIGMVVDVLRNLVEFVAGVFTGDWDRAWGGVKGIFVSIWNGMVDNVEFLINGMINGINGMFARLNSFQITIPPWVPAIGGNSLGFNIPPIGQVNIPRLAQGAVIPPNREFLAVLGDQRHGTNIEAPLETIKQAVAEVVGMDSELLREQNELLRQILDKTGVYLDGREISKTVTRYQRDMARSGVY